MDFQTAYQKAISFAGRKHTDQYIPGSESSYMVHLSNVAMETMIAAGHTSDFDLIFAVQVALLHDVLEDTPCTIEELKDAFGVEIADGVLALSKNEVLEPEVQIPDSLKRIKLQPKEVWTVKLADRTSNMQQPPNHWDKNKRISYLLMAGVILSELKDGNAYLEKRLGEKIMGYDQYIS